MDQGDPEEGGRGWGGGGGEGGPGRGLWRLVASPLPVPALGHHSSLFCRVSDFPCASDLTYMHLSVALRRMAEYYSTEWIYNLLTHSQINGLLGHSQFELL